MKRVNVSVLNTVSDPGFKKRCRLAYVKNSKLTNSGQFHNENQFDKKPKIRSTMIEIYLLWLSVYAIQGSQFTQTD